MPSTDMESIIEQLSEKDAEFALTLSPDEFWAWWTEGRVVPYGWESSD